MKVFRGALGDLSDLYQIASSRYLSLPETFAMVVRSIGRQTAALKASGAD